MRERFEEGVVGSLRAGGISRAKQGDGHLGSTPVGGPFGDLRTSEIPLSCRHDLDDPAGVRRGLSEEKPLHQRGHGLEDFRFASSLNED